MAERAMRIRSRATGQIGWASPKVRTDHRGEDWLMVVWQGDQSIHRVHPDEIEVVRLTGNELEGWLRD